LELGFEEGPDDEAQETNGEQIIAILKEYEAGMKTADLCRKHGIRKASFYKAKYGGLEVSEAKRLKGLKGENAELKLLADDARQRCARLALPEPPSLLNRRSRRT
jgi:putative transposase